MAQESFREILAGFLEEESTVSPRETTVKSELPPVFPSEIPFFQWQTTSATNPNAKNAYPRPAPRPAKIAEVPKAKPAEPKWAASALSSTEQRQLRTLVLMGAPELATEISLTTLKRAHRRLAKQMHPDLAKSKGQEDFLALQSIYECLMQTLNDLARGSESASAPGSRHQDAA